MSESGCSCQCDCLCCAKLHDCCFPCNCLQICFPCLPRSCSTLQDWLHMILLLGVVASAVCTGFSIYVIAASETCASPFCIRQILTLLVAIPSNYSFVMFIQEYDAGSLTKHMQTTQQAVQELVRAHNAEAKELREVIRKMTGNAVAFAMDCFKTRREEFEKFLVGSKLYHAELYEAEMLEAFKRFVRKWVEVYAQSLLDPDMLRQGLEADLRSCETLEETCDTVLQRLTATKSVTLQQRSQELHEEVRHSQNLQEALCIIDDAQQGQSMISSSSALASVDPSKKCGISWLRWGCTSLGLQLGRTRDRDFSHEWPRTVGFGLGSVTVLSARHRLFLYLFIFDIIMILLEVEARRAAVILELHPVRFTRAGRGSQRSLGPTRSGRQKTQPPQIPL
ncbi:unnamed protein product [Effrenium voratum]|uniref:Uncharacterized protein n=1 Tax=Effrenium voratum TaxID=2562239 RepID=A0AA36JDH8_9DINO|nr:unnamed protein product [Effrenium voratum]